MGKAGAVPTVLGRAAWWFLIAVLYAFLLAPIVVGALISFSSAANLAFPPPGWSFRWYTALAQNDDFKQGLSVSLTLAGAVMAGALALGIPVAVAVSRREFPGRGMILSFFTLPLIVPSVVLGLALLLTVAPLGLIGTMPALVTAHLLVTVPFVVRIVAVGLNAVPSDYVEAAMSLGATPFVAFRRVTVPAIMPSVLAAAAIVFIVSMGETAITLFIVGDNILTLPVVMFRFVQQRTDPQLASLSVVFMLMTLLAVAVVQRALGMRRLVQG